MTAPHPHLDAISHTFRATTDEEINERMFCAVLGSEMEKRDIKNDLLHSILYLPLKPQLPDGHIGERHVRRAPESLQSVHYLCICQQFHVKFATKLPAYRPIVIWLTFQ